MGKRIKTAGDMLKKIGQKNLVTTYMTTKLPEALLTLDDHSISSLAVLNDEQTFSGMFTKNDYFKWITNTRVGQVMTKFEDVIRVTVDTPIEECKSIMVRYGFQHLPVFRDKRDNVPLGMLSVRNFLQIP